VARAEAIAAREARKLVALEALGAS
jgi:hypothetical protein